jgi:RNA 3'-terminal phosphate cyclase (ATP)
MAALLGDPLHVVRARARRDRPGLRPQHLTAIEACAEMCDAETEGLEVGAAEFTFAPRSRPRGGRYRWEIGTAGSTTMLAMAVLPLAAWADGPVEVEVVGGVYQDFAPSPHHLTHVLAPLLARMGVRFELDVVRPGYVPRGAGELALRVEPVAAPLRPLRFEERGAVVRVEGIAVSSRLAPARVSDRMADACVEALAEAGLSCTIERVYDDASAQAGAGIAVWATTRTGCRIGADGAGAPGRRSEWIGKKAADELIADLESGATTDRHTADMLVLWAALASGESRWLAPHATEHLATNLWLMAKLGARTRLDGNCAVIEGLSLAPPRAGSRPI